MPDVSKKYYHNQPTTALTTLVAAVPAATVYQVRMIHISNLTAAVATVTLHQVPSGGVAGPTNNITPPISTPPNGITQVTGLFPMEAGETIQGLQTTAAACTVMITGVTTT